MFYIYHFVSVLLIYKESNNSHLSKLLWYTVLTCAVLMQTVILHTKESESIHLPIASVFMSLTVSMTQRRCGLAYNNIEM